MTPIVSHAAFDAAVLALLFGPIAALAAVARFQAWRAARRQRPPWWLS